MFNKNIFALRIKELRLKNNLTQKQFGELFDLSFQAVHDIEVSRRLTSIEKLYNIADYFNVSLDYLVGRSDDPTRH